MMKLNITYHHSAGRDISVGIAARYVQDGLKVEPRCVRGLPHPVRPALGSTQSPVK